MDGCGDAIMLSSERKVTEALAACVFMIRDGVPFTTPVASGILESIPEATLNRLFRDKLGRPVPCNRGRGEQPEYQAWCSPVW